MFYVHPENWGRSTHFDEHIFQMGWFSHQLEKTHKKSSVFEFIAFFLEGLSTRAGSSR